MEGDKANRSDLQTSGVAVVSPSNATVSFVPFRARPISCGASISSTATTTTASTAATTTAAVTTSVTTVTPPRPLSCGSVTTSSLSRTLVKPRPWRFLQKSRMGNAQTRDKAPGEDCTLEGDSDREDDEEEEEEKEKENRDSFDQGTSVDYPGTGGDSGNTKDPSPDAPKQNGDHKTVVQPSDTTRSELENKHGGLYSAYEPVKEKCTTDYSSGLGRRATLPFATDTPRSIFSEGKRPKLPMEPKVVKFTDQERPGRPLSDGSPDKKLVLNAQENAVRIHFVKDITIQSPNAGAPTPTEAEESPPLPGSLPGNKLPLTRSKSEPAESPKRDSLPSPATPVEDLLFSLGYTKVDVIEIPRRSVALSNQDQASLEKRPEKTSTDAAPAKTTFGGKPDTKTTTVDSTPDNKPTILGKPDIKPVVPCKPDNKPIISSKPDSKPVVPSKPESKPIISSKPDSKPMVPSEPDDKPIINSKSESKTTIDSKPDNKPIVPSKPDNKPTTDSKPDSKTTFDSKPEKNVISGHKHEDKPQHEKPSAEEKEKKPSKKVTMQVKEEKPKEHVKLFPWKVEFSTKPKPMTPVSRDEDWRSEEKPVQWSGGKSKEDGSKKHGSKSSKGDTPPVVEPPKKHRGLHLPFRKDKTDKHKHEATTKKSDKGDGAKSPQDKKAVSSPDQPQPQPQPHPHPPQPQQQQQHQPEEQDIQGQPSPEQLLQQETQQEQQQQQQQQQPSQQPEQPRLPPPKPPHLEDLSSSDTQNSDIDSLYGSLRRNQARGIQGQMSESDGEITPQGTARRPPPRRHTVGGAQIQQHLMQGDGTDRKKEAFFELLAQRYPQYADKITGMALYQTNTPAERNPRPREPQRRRTTAVVYSPHGGRILDYEDPGTMSDVELSTFQRGGYARASLPIVRSASSSLERPLGLVFLVYRDETKKALLPNEITTLDTVRALFVRAFPDKLSMEYLDSPKRKIYILEAATNIFFQLEDLRDIKDRTVLKIHECDSNEPQRVRSHPEVRGRSVQQGAPSSRPASRQGFPGEALYREEIAKTQSLPVSSAQSYQELMQKERLQWEMEMQQQSRRSRSRSLTPEPAGAERPRSLSTGAPRTRFSHSPDRLPTPDRAPHLNPIPENPRLLANGFREAMVNGGGHYEVPPGAHPSQHHHSMASPTSHHAPGQPGRVLSPTPVGGPIYESVYATYAHPQQYVSHSMRAAPPSGPQRATGPPADTRNSRRDMVPTNRHSLTFAAMSDNVQPMYDSYGRGPQRSQSYRVTPERDVLPPRPQSATPQDPETRNRMERMEAQIASLAAWVHHCQSPPSEPPRRGPGSSRSTSSTHSESTDTYPGSSASNHFRDTDFSAVTGLSDIPTAYSVRQPVVSFEMRDKIAEVQQRLKELRKEMQTLRRMEQLNQEAIRDAFSDTLIKIKRVMGSVPGAETQVLRHQRVEANTLIQTYMADKERIEKELSDLETSVEELREDVIARRCRVNVSDVEGFALLLSNITKSLADLKSRFPEIHESLKGVMAGEMEIVVKDERFVKEEPLKLEAALKRCKKLTSTLYTLKRLATVQDNRPLHVPSIAMETKDVGDGEKMAILESIRAMVPDHETRVQSLEAADASRERKKKIVTQQESLKFTKSLQTASKSLKPASHSEDDSAGRSEKGDTGAKSDSRDSARVKSPPPEIPAKPARLLSSSELKKSSSGKTESNRPDSAKSDGGSTSAAGAPHVVTMTSQMSDSDDISSSQLANQRSQARMAFFSSLTSPDTASTNTQPEISKPSLSSELSPSTAKATASSSAAVPHSAASSLGSTSSSHGKASSGMYFQAVSPTRSRSAFSSIPLPNKSPLPTSPDASKDKDEGGDGSKPKKVPPPPPPRKSSAKFPYGFVGGSSSSSTVNGGSSGSGKRDGDKSPDGRGKKDTVLTVYKQPSSPTSPSGGITGPLSSTPKPVTPQKPLNKFQKDIAAGIYANMNRPDLQNQRVAPERIITSMASPPPAAVTTNSQDPQYVDDQDLSGSESTGSTTSLDSQQGVALLRSNSAAADSGAGRRSRPEPPQRHSSLSAKGGADESSQKTKTQMLQERSKKLHDGGDSAGARGSKVSQMNGLNGAKDGHKT